MNMQFFLGAAEFVQVTHATGKVYIDLGGKNSEQVFCIQKTLYSFRTQSQFFFNKRLSQKNVFKRTFLMKASL